MTIRLSDLLARIPTDTKERIDRARKRTNPHIRDALRRETGLQLNRQESASPEQPVDSISVPVSLHAGRPETLENIIFEDDMALVVEIGPYRRALEQAKAGISGFRPLLDQLTSIPQGPSHLKGRIPSVETSAGLIADLLALVNRDDPVKRILQVNEDILGVYRYRLPRHSFEGDPLDGSIELYFAVIGLCAAMLAVTAESLATVVLIHELAHAYSHLGADIDGERWDSTRFSKSAHELKEGLAQYYTALICKRLDNQIPETSLAYEELLKRQPPAYQTHMPWLTEYRPEEVRYAMLVTRRTTDGTLQDFQTKLNEARKVLRRQKDEK